MAQCTGGASGSSRRAYFLGIVLLLAAGVLWSLNGALIKLINDSGRGPHAVVIAFYRSLFAGAFLLPSAWGKLHTLRSSRPGARLRIKPAGLSCVAFFALMTVFFVAANTQTTAANAIVLQYTSTFWVFGLSPWLLQERPRANDLGVLAMALTGIGVIFVGQAATDLFGLINALGAGLFYGLLTLMIRRLRDCDSAAVTVMNTLGSAALILPFAIGIGGCLLSRHVLLLLVIMGVVQFGVPYYLYTMGLVRVPAYQAALITMIEPVLVPVWVYLAVGEAVPATTKVGGAIILTALALLILSARRRAPDGAVLAHGEPTSG
ncbi:MAG: DMT family transporter [Phycisphaerae bacterium]